MRKPLQAGQHLGTLMLLRIRRDSTMRATAVPGKCATTGTGSSDTSLFIHEASRAANATTEIRIFRSLEESEAIRADWTALSSHPEHNWELYWNVIRNRKPPPDPYIAALLVNGRVRLALVGRVESSHVPLKLGYWRPVRLSVRRIVIPMQGLIGQGDEDALRSLIGRVVQDLRNAKANLAVFEHLEEDSLLHRAAKGIDLGFSMRDLVPERQIHRYVTLPATFKQYDRQHRRLMEKVRKFEKAFHGRFEHRLLAREDEIAAFCEGADTVMSKTYQRALGVGFCISEENCEKMRAAARQGAWHAFVTLVDGRMVAFWCGCRFANSWLCWWTGYDPDYQQFSPGLVASTRMVERFIAQGMTTIDFGWGDAAHKERLGNEARWEESVCIYSPGFKGILANSIHGLSSAVGNLSRTRLKGFANRLKTPWRRLKARNLARGETHAQSGTTSDSRG